MLDHQELKERLCYNPETGEFHWTNSSLNRAAMRGKKAGSKSTDGYITLKIDGLQKRAHCWAWFYMTGKWPDRDLDHRNRVRDDNRWKNLRLATKSQNGENRGFSGLSWHARDQYWNVCLQKSGKRFYERDTCFGRALKKRNALKTRLHKFGVLSAG